MNIKYDLIHNKYPQHSPTPLQIQGKVTNILHTGHTDQSLAHILGASPKNYSVLGPTSVLGPLSKLNINIMEQ